MSLRDIALLLAMCLIWGLNFPITKWLVSGDFGPDPVFGGAPTMFVGALRFLGIALVLSSLLWPR